MRDHVAHPRRLRRRRAAHANPLIHRLQRARRVVVELEVGLLRGPARPEIDVRLVPDFEIPLRNFVDAVALDQMLRKGRNQRVPLRVVLGRRDDLLVPEGVVVEPRRQLLRHEADLDKGPHAIRQQAVINLVDVRQVVDGVSLRVFVVDAVSRRRESRGSGHTGSR